ncbi:MAG: hypothetical protein BWY56_01087 [Acidobacteria bacterium ADurb.Bin340]|nr:MAG: hypothetical protein BWY56_01087 [Acidobacteria bacterium ADurb.Bin340]
MSVRLGLPEVSPGHSPARPDLKDHPLGIQPKVEEPNAYTMWADSVQQAPQGPPRCGNQYSGGRFPKGMPHRDPAVQEMLRGHAQQGRGAFQERVQGVRSPSKSEPGSAREEERPESAPWCRSFYRPRHLTRVGLGVMRALDPDRRGEADILKMGDSPASSLQARETFLRRRYTALDLLTKGWVFEEKGLYCHLSRIDDRETIRAQRFAGQGDAQTVLKDEQILQWVAVLRRASWDQLLALDFQAQAGVAAALDRLLKEGLLETGRAVLWEGDLEVIGLSKAGWKEVQKMVPLAREWGWAPRKILPNNREYHEQIAGDAVAWAVHRVAQDAGAAPSAIHLDRALRRIYLGSEFVPDIRVEFPIRPGVDSYYEVEVLGRGRDYRGGGHRGKVEGGGFLTFSGRGGESGGGHVRVGR